MVFWWFFWRHRKRSQKGFFEGFRGPREGFLRVFQNFRGRRRVFLGFFEGFLLALEKILKIDRVQPLVFLKDQDFEPPNFLAIKFLIRLRRRMAFRMLFLGNSTFQRLSNFVPHPRPGCQNLAFQRFEPIILCSFSLGFQWKTLESHNSKRIMVYDEISFF